MNGNLNIKIHDIYILLTQFLKEPLHQSISLQVYVVISGGNDEFYFFCHCGLLKLVFFIVLFIFPVFFQFCTISLEVAYNVAI